MLARLQLEHQKALHLVHDTLDSANLIARVIYSIFFLSAVLPLPIVVLDPDLSLTAKITAFAGPAAVHMVRALMIFKRLLQGFTTRVAIAYPL